MAIFDVLTEIEYDADAIMARVVAASTGEARAAADMVAESMREHAPVSTGYLRDNIHAEDDGEGEAVVESDADYSAAVNYGTAFTRAQPFVEPALEEVITSGQYESAAARRVSSALGV